MSKQNQRTEYKPKNDSDPVRYWTTKDENMPKDGPGWYFWDNTWTKIYGPFNSKRECLEKLAKYTKTL